MYLDPLVGAEHNILRWREGTQILYRMDILHTEGLAVAHYCTGVVLVKHILGEHRDIVGAHTERTTQRGETLLEHKRGEVVDTLTTLLER